MEVLDKQIEYGDNSLSFPFFSNWENSKNT